MRELERRVVGWFRRLTDREPLEVKLSDATRRTRLASKGLWFCRLDRPSRPRGRRIRSNAQDVLPIILVTLYGPDDDQVTKAAFAFDTGGRSRAKDLMRWTSSDILSDERLLCEARSYLMTHRAIGLTMSGGTVGCPHEEEFALSGGGQCPQCPKWFGRTFGDGLRERPVQHESSGWFWAAYPPPESPLLQKQIEASGSEGVDDGPSDIDSPSDSEIGGVDYDGACDSGSDVSDG